MFVCSIFYALYTTYLMSQLTANYPNWSSRLLLIIIVDVPSILQLPFYI